MKSFSSYFYNTSFLSTSFVLKTEKKQRPEKEIWVGIAFTVHKEEWTHNQQGRSHSLSEEEKAIYI